MCRIEDFPVTRRIVDIIHEASRPAGKIAMWLGTIVMPTHMFYMHVLGSVSRVRVFPMSSPV